AERQFQQSFHLSLPFEFRLLEFPCGPGTASRIYPRISDDPSARARYFIDGSDGCRRPPAPTGEKHRQSELPVENDGRLALSTRISSPIAPLQLGGMERRNRPVGQNHFD